VQEAQPRERRVGDGAALPGDGGMTCAHGTTVAQGRPGRQLRAHAARVVHRARWLAGSWTAPAGWRYDCPMPQHPEIQGECPARFHAVRDVFAQNLRERDEIGAAVTVVVDGDPVVDLWAGHADLGRTRPWERDTLVNVYSCTKGMTALCAHRLVAEGRLDLAAPAAPARPHLPP